MCHLGYRRYPYRLHADHRSISNDPRCPSYTPHSAPGLQTPRYALQLKTAGIQ